VKKRRKITSRQVAEKAGVSQTTVSFVLNDVENSNISQETRQRVLQAAQELNYVPDVAARALARGRSNNIALVLSRPHRQIFIDEYIPNILTGLSSVTQERGFRIMVEMIDDRANSNAYTSLIQGKEVAGLLVNRDATSPDDIQHLIDCAEDGFPIVTLDYWHPVLHTVAVDKLAGVRMIVNHLIQLGHRRIACIGYAPKGNVHADSRIGVYRETLEAAGIDFDPALVRYGEYDPDTGYAAMRSLLTESSLPTALYAMNDVMAFGAIAALHEQGICVPDDFAVVGFDDSRLSRYCTPPLTTIHEPDIEHGCRAGEMLIDLINGKEPPEPCVKLDTTLIVRESCGASRTNHE
jgi:DNA-binding LacI/PurR family transcriptional regulator